MYYQIIFEFNEDESDPAIAMRDELRLIKAKEPTIISGRELKEKKKQGKP